ncbi:response regulator [Paenibacillus sp. N4]|uniref:response regulator n=1 Tax=Paenibacillus vietnamensis TaxID=2590547 RepID=UPI001CD07C8C|nr:response regulator [Paenibacillus vietnamensis]MCA0757600.1 response regulator [Paenibacillus vietnamensis]
MSDQQGELQLLLVDDEASVVDSLADTLPWRDIGITKVFKAYSGFEALEILRTNPVDILISDIRMPGMTGLELLSRVRRSWKKIKCILLSGHADFAYAQQAIAHETYDYLLKPASDEELLSKVGGAATALREERDETRFRQRIAQAFQESLPKLRGELLNELLQGLKYAPERLTDKLESLKINMAHGESFAMMLVRLEGHLPKLDFYSLSLMEYAVANMAEELFEDWFRLWSCKSVHGYLVFVVTVPEEKRVSFASQEQFSQAIADELQQKAAQLQLSVSHYLKGSVSVLINKWGSFPHDITRLYEDVLLALRRQVGSQSELFVQVSGEAEQPQVHSLQRLYEPPQLVHLLESGNFEPVEEKLTAIWEELNRRWADSPEHLLEVFFSVYASFSSFAHKNGRELADVIGSALSDVSGLTPTRSAAALHQWMFQSFQMLRQCMENETRNDRELTVRKIKQYVRKHLVDDVSLQSIADYMYMHPVHVSRIFKLETGDNLSDYVLRLKMELAVSLLADPSLKSYEIALRLGYQNPNYFNKVFKKYYSLTPQEYRQKLDGGDIGG